MELAQLSQLNWLLLQDNSLTGSLPRSPLQPDGLEVLCFGDQDCCAPGDEEFQALRGSIPDVDGPTCAGLQFAAGIADQSFPRAQPITPLVLPEVTGGVAQVTYALTPVLPKELDFAPASRTVSGTPTRAAAVRVWFAYAATNAAGSADSLQSSIEAYSPVGARQKTLPESFALRGTHPNPFGELTRLEMDIP